MDDLYSLFAWRFPCFQPSESTFLGEYVGKLAFLPLPHGTGRDFEERGKLGLCQAELLSVRFELFGKAH